MDYEPLTNAEQKIVEEVEKMFGDKDLTLKNIMLYTRLLDLNPDDDELKAKLIKLKTKIKQVNSRMVINVSEQLKCSLDSSGNIVHI